MKTSDRGLALIKSFEGLRLKTYLDPVGIPTIGYGHTGPDVVLGGQITAEQAEELLRGDLARFERAVERMVRIQLKQWEFDALVSLCYNIGPGALSNSTLLKEVNLGNRIRAAQEFIKWIHAGGRPLRGLLRRRLDEAALFIGGDS